MFKKRKRILSLLVLICFISNVFMPFMALASSKDVTGVKLDKSTLTLEVGKSGVDLNYTISPPNASEKRVSWRSSNISVATVNTSGLVSPVSAGTATITVTTVDGGFTDTCVVTVLQPVTGVNLNKSTLALEVGGNGEVLVATVVPSNASDTRLSWKSSNVSVAAVDDTGLVSPVSAGTATITVTTVDKNKTATCTVTVLQPVTGVRLNKETMIIEVGGTTETLVATVLPPNASNTKVTWASNNTQIATVNANTGEVTAVETGAANITATTENGGFVATCIVTVVNKVALRTKIQEAESKVPQDYTQENWSKIQSALGVAKGICNAPNSTQIEIDNALTNLTAALLDKIIPVTTITLETKSLTLNVGESSSALIYAITPLNATFKDVNWSSSDNSIATVNNGIITANKVGQVNISVIATSNNAIFDMCVVNVVSVVKTSLNSKIDEAKDIVKNYYTDESWTESGIENAIEVAEGVASNTDATQAQVDNAISLIEQAIAKLVKKSLDEIASEAEAVAERAQRINSEILALIEKYKDISWDVFVEYGKMILNNIPSIEAKKENVIKSMSLNESNILETIYNEFIPISEKISELDYDREIVLDELNDWINNNPESLPDETNRIESAIRPNLDIENIILKNIISTVTNKFQDNINAIINDIVAKLYQEGLSEELETEIVKLLDERQYLHVVSEIISSFISRNISVFPEYLEQELEELQGVLQNNIDTAVKAKLVEYIEKCEDQIRADIIRFANENLSLNISSSASYAELKEAAFEILKNADDKQIASLISKLGQEKDDIIKNINAFGLSSGNETIDDYIEEKLSTDIANEKVRFAGVVERAYSKLIAEIRSLYTNLPVITISDYTLEPTNQDITVTASVYRGTLNQKSYTFTENGSFEFVATDALGNIVKELVTIYNIDKVAPNAPTLSPNIMTNTYDSVSVTVQYPEDARTKQYKLGDGTWIGYQGPIAVSQNTTVYARCIDAAGNISLVNNYKVTNILVRSSGGGGTSYVPAASTAKESVTLLQQNQTNKVQATIVADSNCNASISTTLLNDILTKIDKLKTDKVDNIVLLINVDGEYAENCEIIIPDKLIKELNKREIKNIEVLTNIGQINLQVKSLLKDTTLDYILKFKKWNNEKLNEAEKSAVGKSLMFEYSLFESTKLINKRSTILLPYQLKNGENPDNLTVFAILDNGKLVNLGGRYIKTQGVIEFTTNGATKFFVRLGNTQFDDIDEFAWAKTQINSLFAKGIIDGISNNKYGPQLKLTRAQFATMLVNFLRLTNDGSELKFTDVSKDTWYYNQIAAAVQNGLIKGKSDSSFSPDEYITRQDLAVMVNRVLQSKGITSSKTSVVFKDIQSIDEYARESVNQVVNAGIMRGNPDGTFKSINNVTRAEAAVVIYNLLNK